MLLKLATEDPVMFCIADVPENLTVPLLCANDPLVNVKLFFRSRMPEVEVNEVPDRVNGPEVVMFPLPPKNVPPEKLAALPIVMMLAPCVMVPVKPALT